MTKIQEYLDTLPEDKKALFEPIFGNVDKFYDTVYLLNKNAHSIDLQKPDRYEDRLATIEEIKKRFIKLLHSYGLDGKEIMDDIASDYFEDFVQYKEDHKTMDQQEFIDIIKKVTNQK